jgi:heme A synthase
MNKLRVWTMFLILIALFCSSAFAWKKEAHFISLPLIEGMGIYSSVRVLQDSKSPWTKSSAIATLSLLACDAGLGSYIIFDQPSNYALLRRIHRYIGIAIMASALFMSVCAGNDRHIENSDRNIMYGYSLVSSIPIIVFSF